jgi:hypothetical protein
VNSSPALVVVVIDEIVIAVVEVAMEPSSIV